MKNRLLNIAVGVFIACFGAFMISQAANISGTNLAAPVAPFTTDDTYPTHYAEYGKGGAMQFAYSTQLRTIPETRRTRGMFAYAADSRTTYQLYSTPGHHWRPFTSGGGTTDISGKLDVSRFLNYSAKGRVPVDISGKLDASVLAPYTSALASAQSPSGSNPFATIYDLGHRAGAALVYYFCDHLVFATTPPWHELESDEDGGQVSAHTATTSNYTELDRYVTSALNTTVIPAGEWDFNLYGSTSTVNSPGQFMVQVYRVDSAGAIVGSVLGTGYSTTFTHTSPAAVSASVFIAGQTGWSTTDRVGVVVSGKRGNVAATVTFYHDRTNGYLSTMTSPISLLHDGLPGLNQGDYQHLTVAEKTAITTTTGFENYTRSVNANYATGAMLVSHNAGNSSHNNHFTNTSNPHSVTAAQAGAVSDARFDLFSSHWGRADANKLDVGRFTSYSAAGRAYAHNTEMADVVGLGAALALKLPKTTFDDYTGRVLNLTQGAQGPPGADGMVGYDGRTITPLRCEISSGTRNILYDSDGANPSPSLVDQYLAYMYDGDVMLTPTYYEWFVPSSKTVLTAPEPEMSGLQDHRQYYIPTIQAQFSSNKTNNYVRVLMMYSSSQPNLKRYCSASVPVGISKLGQQGIQGPQGESGVATQDAVLGLFSSAGHRLPLNLQADGTTPIPKLTFRAANGNIQAYVKSNGAMAFYNASGSRRLMNYSTGRNSSQITLTDGVTYHRIKMLNDGQLEMYDNTGKLFLKLHSLNRQLQLFRGNGTTAAFTIYSSGRWIGGEGLPTSATKTRPYVTTGGFRGYTTQTSTSTGLPSTHVLPAAGMNFSAPSGKVRFSFYTSGRFVIY